MSSSETLTTSATRARFTLSTRWSGGEGRVRGAYETVWVSAHLTLLLLRNGSLPLPPEGQRGASWGS
jgi:hypothetical protein